jgi:phosphoribosylamine---glycine ligase
MKVLIVGSGGREHALAWKIRKSPVVKEVYCAPGNGGINQVAQGVDIPAEDIDMLLKFAKDKGIDLTVVGPEAPLVGGIVDQFRSENMRIFGPDRFSAQLEGSKVFAKEFMERWRIPTAGFNTFSDYTEAKAFLEETQFPLVIKADGLAAGKGVFICTNLAEGLTAIEQIMQQRIFQEAGDKIIIEECLKGEEASILAVSDGRDYVILDSAQDHKRIFDDDLGPNTGGMGAYSPAPVVTQSMARKIEARVIAPAIHGMWEEGHPFRGVLYAGLMIVDGSPYVLEFNVRFGDPETQAVLPRLKNDLMDLIRASCDGGINRVNLKWDRRNCVCVVLSSGGYPGNYEKGKELHGLESAAADPDIMIFHAGTKRVGDKIVTSGGRVLGVTGLGLGIEAAIAKTYEAVEKINFDRCFFRRDIGAKAIKKINAVTRE